MCLLNELKKAPLICSEERPGNASLIRSEERRKTEQIAIANQSTGKKIGYAYEAKPGNASLIRSEERQKAQQIATANQSIRKKSGFAYESAALFAAPIIL